MEIKIDFAHWLSKKLYLQTVGVYANLVLAWGLMFIFTKFFALSFTQASVPLFVVIFFGGFFSAFLFGVYEGMVIREKSLREALLRSYKKWHDKPDDPFVRLNAKLKMNVLVFWMFYGGLAVLTYIFYRGLNYNFYPVFLIVFFLSMVTKEGATLEKIYEMRLTAKSWIAIFVWSAVCAFLSTAIVFGLVNYFNFSLLIAVVTSVILVGLVQLLGSRKFILGL